MLQAETALIIAQKTEGARSQIDENGFPAGLVDNVDNLKKAFIYKGLIVGNFVDILLILQIFKIITFIFPQLELKYLYINGSKWGDGIEF